MGEEWSAVPGARKVQTGGPDSLELSVAVWMLKKLNLGPSRKAVSALPNRPVSPALSTAEVMKLLSTSMCLSLSSSAVYSPVQVP